MTYRLSDEDCEALGRAADDDGLGMLAGHGILAWQVEKIVAREVAALRRWKDEALPVLAGLQELGRTLGIGLGQRVTGPEAVEAAEGLRARAEAAEAKVAAVEALADRADDRADVQMRLVTTIALRAALGEARP